MAALLVLVAVLGLAIGSFLNVVIYRVPRGESLVRPPSHCPSCGEPVRNRHNIPVLSWIMLRGRCADCRAPISVRYPLVEAATAVLFVAVTVRLDRLGLLSALPAYLYFVAIGVALAAIDLDCHRLPLSIVLPSYPVLACLLLIATVVNGDWWALARAGIGAVAMFTFYFAVAYAYPAGMGLGDVKLSGIPGGVLGYLSWAALPVGTFAGFLLGAVVSLGILAAGRAGRKSEIPFGPFMIAGALVAIFAAASIAGAYTRLLGWS